MQAKSEQLYLFLAVFQLAFQFQLYDFFRTVEQIFRLRVIEIVADGRTRTDTKLPRVDFESTASTNSATPASVKNTEHKVYVRGLYRKANLDTLAGYFAWRFYDKIYFISGSFVFEWIVC